MTLRSSMYYGLPFGLTTRPPKMEDLKPAFLCSIPRIVPIPFPEPNLLANTSIAWVIIG
jgi:hypothetical protein